MKVSVKLVIKRKAQKSTGSTIAQNGTRSEGRSKRLSESGSKKREPRRRSGSGKDVLLRILPAKANGTGVISARKSGSPRSTRAGTYQQKGPKATWPLTALFWVPLESGRACGWSVVQLDCNEELGPLHMGCTARLEAELEWKSSRQSRGRS